ncbi:hypothetical protein [Thiomonas sp.]
MILMSALRGPPVSPVLNAPQPNSVVRAEQMLVRGFQQWQIAFSGYTAATNSVLPATSGWAALLTPRYGFLPAAPQGQSWAYGTGIWNGAASGWFCLSGTFSCAEAEAAEYANRYFPNGTVFYNAGCGATSDAAPAGYPAAMAVTYWAKSAAKPPLATASPPVTSAQGVASAPAGPPRPTGRRSGKGFWRGLRGGSRGGFGGNILGGGW